MTPSRSLTQYTQLKRNSENLEFVVIDNPKATATISLFGGHLCHYQRHNEPAIIWMSQTAQFDGKRPIRGGIPICWPWFGPAPKRVGSDKQSHGFARNHNWQLDGVSEHPDGTLVHLSLCDNPLTRALWDQPFELQLDILVGDELKLILTSVNSGDTPLVYSGAMHSYFNISAPENASLKGLGPRYYDSLTQSDGTQQGDFSFAGPVDRIYLEPETEVILKDRDRNLKILSGNHDSIVVWNPWIEGAKAFTDMPDNGYQSMLCAETAITAAEGVTVSPGEEHCLSLTIC
ncbi:D-hexose-6-phosphate mutarotase [Dongshaea marina]|uniref:D-hexose-6-phosphate mutarotase n=1 Tax=Dongshaea marina TaxID=2047966 RepID=UPI00389969E1